jgi:hypothetical protein
MARDQSPSEAAQGTAAQGTAAQGTEARAATGEAGRHRVPQQAPRYDEGSAGNAGLSGAALGFTALAAVLMIMSGILNFMEGLAALIRGSFFVVLPNYAYNISVTGWGWFHLILGLVVLAAGVGLFLDRAWARYVGVGIAAISAVINFLYIPYQPVWSIVVLAVDVAIIWALLTPRRRYA